MENKNIFISDQGIEESMRSTFYFFLIFTFQSYLIQGSIPIDGSIIESNKGIIKENFINNTVNPIDLIETNPQQGTPTGKPENNIEILSSLSTPGHSFISFNDIMNFEPIDNENIFASFPIHSPFSPFIPVTKKDIDSRLKVLNQLEIFRKHYPSIKKDFERKQSGIMNNFFSPIIINPISTCNNSMGNYNNILTFGTVMNNNENVKLKGKNEIKKTIKRKSISKKKIPSGVQRKRNKISKNENNFIDLTSNKSGKRKKSKQNKKSSTEIEKIKKKEFSFDEKMKIEFDMVGKFGMNINLEKGILICANIYCNSPLDKVKDISICHDCHEHFDRTGKLRGENSI